MIIYQKLWKHFVKEPIIVAILTLRYLVKNIVISDFVPHLLGIWGPVLWVGSAVVESVCGTWWDKVSWEETPGENLPRSDGGAAPDAAGIPGEVHHLSCLPEDLQAGLVPLHLPPGGTAGGLQRTGTGLELSSVSLYVVLAEVKTINRLIDARSFLFQQLWTLSRKDVYCCLQL